MAITVNGVLCQEIVDGFSEEVDILTGPTAKKGFLCPWGSRYQVAVGLLGLTNTTSIGGLITLFTPAQYPEIPYMYAHHIEIEPKGLPIQSSPQLAYNSAIVWAHYKCFPWSFNPTDDEFNSIGPYIYAEQELNSSTEFFTVPGRGTQFAGSHLPTGADYGFRLAIVEIVITLHRVPYLPTSTVLAAAGFANSTPYLGLAQGQLMFMGCKSKRKNRTDGRAVTDITYIFSARSVRWDYAFDPSAGIFDQVLTGVGGQPFVPLTDLSTIIPSAYGY